MLSSFSETIFNKSL